MTDTRSRSKRKSAQDNGQEMTPEQMQELIQAEKKIRAEQCLAKIEKLLEEDKCQLHPFPFYDEEGRTKAGVNVIAV